MMMLQRLLVAVVWALLVLGVSMVAAIVASQQLL